MSLDQCIIRNLKKENEQLKLKLEKTQSELTIAQANNHKRNIELDALHYVWCNGGCPTGVHRYTPQPLTEEIVYAAINNTNRLITYAGDITMKCCPYIFVIDTDAYAGNFECELCAYVTGKWDGETHGETQANIFKQEVPPNIQDEFEYLVKLLPTCDDDVPILSHECLIYNDQTKQYTGVGIFFDQEPPTELINLMKERAIKFSKEGTIFNKPVSFTVTNFYAIKQSFTSTKETV
jgi:hypothetical protein